VFDTSMALLAGDRVWRDPGGSTPSTRERVAASVLVIFLAVTALTMWVVTSERIGAPSPSMSATRRHELLLVAVAGTSAAGALAVHPLTVALGHRLRPWSFWWCLGWRITAYLVMTISFAAVLTRQRFLGAVPIGIVIGTDAAMTIWVLDLRPRPMRWALRALTSGVHFGAIGALLAMSVLDPDGVSIRTAASVYGTMWALLGVAGVTVVLADRLAVIAATQVDLERDEMRTRERELRVHWLHDDVLSEVKLARLRLESSSDTTSALREFDELDHRLRLRQLEESLRGGSVPLYEILQPHLRRVQTAGVTIERVPSLDQTSRRFDESAGRTVHRVLANLVSNSIAAGASTLSLVIVERCDPAILDIAVIDDAGGFSVDDIKPGRGLWLLQRDLGADAVRIERCPGGSVVSVAVPIEATGTDRRPGHAHIDEQRESDPT
jgi:hypothetical protein